MNGQEQLYMEINETYNPISHTQFFSSFIKRKEKKKIKKYFYRFVTYIGV